MRKIILSALIVAIGGLLFDCETYQVTVDVPEHVNLPKNVQFLSQSCDADSLYQTVIDLANNELVVLQYANGILQTVYRTGIIVDPKIHRMVKGKDAPFEDDSFRDTDDDTDIATTNTNPPVIPGPVF
ncbi:MAG: hypothetical protein JW881_01000 [Spirochaetales bacterium]|nr:hypothetical protein [Spirochaetales bacterium]